jgi:thioredoxin-related protein
MGCQILAFSTEDCPACDIVKPLVKEAASKFGIEVRDLDPTSEIELAQEFSVSVVPTFVLLDSEGSFVESVDGFLDESTVNSFLSLSQKEVVA